MASGVIERVGRRCEVRGWSIDDLATHSGIGQPTTNDLLEEKICLSVEEIVILAQTFGVTTDYLLGMSDTPTNDEVPPPDPRTRLPDERKSVTHKFSVGGHEGYLTVGFYPESKDIGELFITMSKQGSTVAGLMDGFATMMSIALQYGVPLRCIVKKLKFTRFEPSGWTGNPAIREATSILDYIGHWLENKFLSDLTEHEEVVIDLVKHDTVESNSTISPSETSQMDQTDAPSCVDCGSIMIRSGTCYRCMNCGSTSGCS